MHADDGDLLVDLRVDDADVVGFGVGNVDLVARGVGGDAGGLGAHCNRLYVAELRSRIDDADRVALAIGDVSVFVIAGRDRWRGDGRRSRASASADIRASASPAAPQPKLASISERRPPLALASSGVGDRLGHGAAEHRWRSAALRPSTDRTVRDRATACRR